MPGRFWIIRVTFVFLFGKFKRPLRRRSGRRIFSGQQVGATGEEKKADANHQQLQKSQRKPR
jgi:hypothetical protein